MRYQDKARDIDVRRAQIRPRFRQIAVNAFQPRQNRHGHERETKNRMGQKQRRKAQRHAQNHENHHQRNPLYDFGGQHNHGQRPVHDPLSDKTVTVQSDRHDRSDNGRRRRRRRRQKQRTESRPDQRRVGKQAFIPFQRKSVPSVRRRRIVERKNDRHEKR